MIELTGPTTCPGNPNSTIADGSKVHVNPGFTTYADFISCVPSSCDVEIGNQITLIASPECTVPNTPIYFTWTTDQIDGVLPNVTGNNITVTPEEDITYKVVASTSCCCVKDSKTVHALKQSEEDENPNSINQSINLDIKPNPASKEFTVIIQSSDKSNEGYLLDIMDIYGRLIIQRNIVLNEGNFIDSYNLNLTDGVYLLRVFNNNREAIKQVVINQ